MKPTLFRILIVLLSVVSMAAAVFYLWLGTLHLSAQVGEFKVTPAVIAFEMLALLAVAMGIHGAWKNNWKAVGLATACVAGTIATTAVLSFLDLRENVAAGMQQPLRGALMARLAAGVGITAIGALVVVLRRPRSLLDLALAAAFAVPPVVVFALISQRGFTWLGMVPDEPPGAIAVTSLTIGSLVLLVCLSGMGHLVIRAFERGVISVLPGDEPGTPV